MPFAGGPVPETRCSVLPAALLGLLALAGAARAQGEPLFPAPLIHVAAPDCVASADFNGDTIPDLAAASSTGSQIFVALGLGDGAFGPAAGITVGTGSGFVTAADLNGDTLQDLVTASSTANTVSVLLGDGLGGFGAPVPTAVGTGPRCVAVGLLDADAFPDLVSANGAGGTVSILINDGLGGFPSASSQSATATNPVAIILVDLNADTKLDAVTANTGSNNVSVLLGNGLGGLGTAVAYSTGLGSSPAGLVAGDVNEDTKLDVVTVNPANDSLSVMLGTGTGSFAPHPAHPLSGDGASALIVLDFNVDDDLDLATANTNAGTVTMLSGDGDGHFTAIATVTVGSQPASLRVTDVTGDSVPDLVTANRGDKAVGILLGLGGTDFLAAGSVGAGAGPAGAALADLDDDALADLVTVNAGDDSLWVRIADGTGGFGAPLALATDPHPRAVAAADLDGNGDPDLVSVNAPAPTGPGTVSVLLADGAGGFLPQASSEGGLAPQALAIGDVNHDTFVDLVIGNPAVFAAAGSVSVRLGDGTGTFGVISTVPVGFLPTTSQSLALADVTGDDNVDLVTADAFGLFSSAVKVLPGDGLGGFGTAVDLPIPSGQVQDVVVGDFNGDEVPDIATINSAFLSTATVSVLLGTGAGAFDPAVSTSAGLVFFTGLGADDLDADGNLDLVTTNRVAPDDAAILLGDGLGGFGTPRFFASGSGPVGLALGDIDGGQRPDIVVANDDGTVTVLVNQLPPVPPPPIVWTDIGFAKDGVTGLPVLVGTGTLEAGTPGTLELTNANPLSFSILFVALSSTPTPFKGGTLVAFPPLLMLPLTTDGSGAMLLPFLWPTGFAPGTFVYFQFAIQDAAAVQNVS